MHPDDPKILKHIQDTLVERGIPVCRVLPPTTVLGPMPGWLYEIELLKVGEVTRTINFFAPDVNFKPVNPNYDYDLQSAFKETEQKYKELIKAEGESRVAFL